MNLLHCIGLSAMYANLSIYCILELGLNEATPSRPNYLNRYTLEGNGILLLLHFKSSSALFLTCMMSDVLVATLGSLDCS